MRKLGSRPLWAQYTMKSSLRWFDSSCKLFQPFLAKRRYHVKPLYWIVLIRSNLKFKLFWQDEKIVKTVPPLSAPLHLLWHKWQHQQINQVRINNLNILTNSWDPSWHLRPFGSCYVCRLQHVSYMKGFMQMTPQPNSESDSLVWSHIWLHLCLWRGLIGIPRVKYFPPQAKTQFGSLLVKIPLPIGILIM